MRSLCGFDSLSSDYASPAQWQRSCFVISRLSVQIRREALIVKDYYVRVVKWRHLCHEDRRSGFKSRDGLMQIGYRVFQDLQIKIYLRRIMDRPDGYEPSEARSIRAGDTVAVAERLCSGL